MTEEFFRSGRQVIFVTTRVIWYALRVYIQDRDGNTKLLARTEHTTLAGVQV